MVCDGILTGVVSGGIGCAEPLLPGIYADVFHYLNWIINGTELVVIVKKRNNTGNYGTSNTSSIVVIIFFVLLSITSRP